MRLERVINFAHRLAEKTINNDDSTIVDATCGNGHDTLFLSKLAQNGSVYAFDIQEQAIRNTRQLLSEHEQIKKVNLIQDSHEFILDYVKESSVDLIMFNLGYLPGADVTVTTKGNSSIDAIKSGLQALKKNGVIIIVLYPGHEEGMIEANDVETFITTLDFKYYQSVKYGFINNIKNPPYVIAIERVK